MTVTPGSRYEEADRSFAPVYLYDDKQRPVMEEGEGGYRRPVRTTRSALYLSPVLPRPPQPPVEYFAKETESFQFIAFRFMEDSTKWWELAEVNPQVWYPLDLQPGDSVHIPT